MTRVAPFQHVSAGGMSLLVHGMFIAFLLFGVSWRSQPHLPVEAELWSALPEPPAPPPLSPPEPVPAAIPPPEVAKPEAAKPDIALERAEKKRREQEAREQEALQRKEAARQAELQRQAEEQARLKKEKAEKAEQAEKLRQEQVQRAQARREMEQELARQAQDELDAEETQLRGALQKQQARASRQDRLVDEFRDRIRSKILGYLRLPHNLSGNPEVVFKVTLLPNGEVLRAFLVRSSGQPAYDHEMERAILRASPLPLPNERDAAAVFRDGLILKFRPRDE
jgi:colicin import membrane protein